MILNAAWTAAAAWLRREIACQARLADPADRRRHPDAKARRSLTTGHPGLNRCNNTPTKINRKRLRHTSWPPSPAPTMNHKNQPVKIPHRFIPARIRSRFCQVLSGSACTGRICCALCRHEAVVADRATGSSSRRCDAVAKRSRGCRRLPISSGCEVPGIKLSWELFQETPPHKERAGAWRRPFCCSWGYAAQTMSPMGRSRRRLPVAWKTALPIAGATGGTPGSPTPEACTEKGCGTICVCTFCGKLSERTIW